MQDPTENSAINATFKTGAPSLEKTLALLNQYKEQLIRERDQHDLILAPHIEKLLMVIDKLESKAEKTPELFLQLNQAIYDLVAAQITNPNYCEQGKQWLSWLLEMNRDLEAGLQAAMRSYVLLLSADLQSYRNIEKLLLNAEPDEQAGLTIIIGKMTTIIENPSLNSWLALEKVKPLLPERFAADFAFAKEHVQKHKQANQAAMSQSASPKPCATPKPSQNFLLKILATALENKFATTLLVLGAVGLVVGGLALGGIPIAGVVIGLLTAKIVTAVTGACFLAGAIGFFGPGRRKNELPTVELDHHQHGLAAGAPSE